jgi:hypothetical protein
VTQLTASLPGITCKNAKSAIEHGEMMTDTIASWVKKGVVAGPFAKKPLENFRVNPLMAVAQKDKVRPILNLSSPKNRSFNDAVKETAIAKLEMSSAKIFGEEIFRHGPGAVFAKYDIKDAYKLIPGDPDQWQCFGFRWLGRYFYDTTTVFGSKSAPANFDALPETLVNIVCTTQNLPKRMVHRQLDDVPIVSAKDSGLTKKFADAYMDLCEKIGVPLAEMCPDREKAFGPGTCGTVLGVRFDSENLQWSWSQEKVDRAIRVIDDFLLKTFCKLKEVQVLHGKLNDFAQMHVFMNGFRFHIVQLLANFGDDEKTRKLVGSALKNDLWIWKKCINTAVRGFPIPEPWCRPPITARKFVSDAAGAAFAEAGNENRTKAGDRGVASIGFGKKIFFCGGTKWPFSLLTRARDEKGALLGRKSATLECVGLLIPFLTDPKSVKNCYVLLHVDNISLIYGWEKRYVKNDQHASLLVRCLHVIEAFLECRIFVEHVKRMSTDMAVLADHLSRESTTTAADLACIQHLHWHELEGPLKDWLSNPVLDWQLPRKLVTWLGTRFAVELRPQ